MTLEELCEYARSAGYAEGAREDVDKENRAAEKSFARMRKQIQDCLNGSLETSEVKTLLHMLLGIKGPYLAINELCGRLDAKMVAEYERFAVCPRDHAAYASNNAAPHTPWFDSLDELDTYCKGKL